MAPAESFDGRVGPLDVEAMTAIRETVCELDGLVDRERTGLDDLVDPGVLPIVLDDGIGEATACRFDVTWYRSGHYCVHHVDDAGVNYRYDRHPKDGAPTAHFHPPPDAPSADVEPSCIAVREPRLVVRAVHALWRRAYESGRVDAVNVATDPP